MDILSDSIMIYKEWTGNIHGTRRAKHHSANNGILRNENMTVKHVAAMLLYVKHKELSFVRSLLTEL